MAARARRARRDKPAKTSPTRSIPPSSSPQSTRTLWWALLVILAGGAPIGWATFAYPQVLDARAGPFGLLPLMVWPGVVAFVAARGRGFPWRPPTIAGAAISLVYPLVVVAVTAALAVAFGAAPGAPVENWSRALAPWPRDVFASFAGALFPVLGEELAWRGYFQQRLAARGPDRAMVLAAAAATTFHALALFSAPLRATGPAGIASFLAAVFLLNLGAGAIFRIAGGSVWASFVFHVVWNATCPVFTSNIYGGEPGLIGGTPWVVSGEGLVGVAASLVCLPGLWWWARRPCVPAPPRAQTSGRRFAWAALGVAIVAGGALASRAPDPSMSSEQPTATTSPLETSADAASPHEAPRETLRIAVRRAFDRGFAFLESNLEALSLDAVFLLRLVEGALPSSRAGALATRALPAAERDPTYPLFREIVARARPPHAARKLLDLEVAGTPNPRQAFDEKFSDQCLRGALECRWAPGCEPYKKRPGQWGYVLTHQVLFYLFALEKNCAAKMGIDAREFLDRLSRAMWKEQLADPTFSDLAMERIALGAYAGQREFLKDDWIRSAIAAQKTDGCWWWREDEPVCSDHATGMTLWVLALWLRETQGG